MASKLPKLVRDAIPNIIRASGCECEIEYVSGEEYIKALDAKLDEEVAEYHESHSIEELADLLEVIYAVADARGYNFAKLNDARWDKYSARGGFCDGVILKNIKMPIGNGKEK